MPQQHPLWLVGAQGKGANVCECRYRSNVNSSLGEADPCDRIRRKNVSRVWVESRRHNVSWSLEALRIELYWNNGQERRGRHKPEISIGAKGYPIEIRVPHGSSRSASHQIHPKPMCPATDDLWHWQAHQRYCGGPTGNALWCALQQNLGGSFRDQLGAVLEMMSFSERMWTSRFGEDKIHGFGIEAC